MSEIDRESVCVCVSEIERVCVSECERRERQDMYFSQDTT